MQVFRLRILSIVTLAIGSSSFLPSCPAQTASGTVPEQAYQGLNWRLIGPFRAGRSAAASGVPGSSTTFYFGSVGGGIWKNYGCRHGSDPDLRSTEDCVDWSDRGRTF